MAKYRLVEHCSSNNVKHWSIIDEEGKHVSGTISYGCPEAAEKNLIEIVTNEWRVIKEIEL